MRVNDRARDVSNFSERDDDVASDPQQRGSGVRARAERVPSATQLAVKESPQLSIAMPASEAMLEPTYAYLSAYCFALFGPTVALRLNVAVYELLANALRHGAPGSEARVELTRLGQGVALVVHNRAEPAELARLQQQIERVQSDPGAAFANEMDRFVGASQPPPMLGIVRVAHEAGLRLELSIDQSDVRISTWCR
jgi:signal transduction histidine kinase